MILYDLHEKAQAHIQVTGQEESIGVEEMKAESSKEDSLEKFGNKGRERVVESSKAKCGILQSRKSFECLWAEEKTLGEQERSRMAGRGDRGRETGMDRWGSEALVRQERALQPSRGKAMAKRRTPS